MSECSIDELKDHFKEQKVIDIIRMKAKIEGILTPIDTYIVTFQTNSLPKTLKLSSYYQIKVEEYIERPRQCYNCQKFGHASKYCRQKEEKICSKCGEKGHIRNDCTEQEFCCFNCKGNHPSTSRDYIKYIAESETLKTQMKLKIPKPQAQTLFLESNPNLKYLYEKPKKPSQNKQTNEDEQPQENQSRMQTLPTDCCSNSQTQSQNTLANNSNQNDYC